MLRDLHHALRTMRQQPAAHGVILLILGTALATATAIFSLVDAALLRPLPYPEPRRLVEIRERAADGAADSNRVLAADFVNLVDESRTLKEIVAILSTGMPITSLSEPMNPLMRRSSAGYFRLLGVEPLLGRAFLPEEDRVGGGRVTILSHELWRSHLGGDPEVLGQTLGLDGEPYEIVGILPPGFRDPRFVGRPALWLPLALTPEDLDREARRPRRLTAVFGRLEDGVSMDQARGEIERIGVGLAERFPEPAGRITTVRSLYEVVVEGYRPALLTLFGAALFLLAVAFSNVVHLLLARALGRRRELALRLALGASRGQLARQLVAESLLLALGGLGLGLLLAAAGLEPLLALLPDGFAVPRLETVGIDVRAVGFAFVLALVFGFGFGLVPLSQTPHGQNPMPTLNLVVRSSLADPSLLAEDLQRKIWEVSRDAPIYDFAALPELLRDVDWQPRFLMRLLLGFACLSLLLAASGLYAVLSHMVAGDVRDIGIRMALGARRSQIQRQVLHQAMALAALGVLLGLPLTFAAGRLLRSQLAGVSATDPWVLGGVAALVGAVTLLASDLPARRASRVDPVVVLRES